MTPSRLARCAGVRPDDRELAAEINHPNWWDHAVSDTPTGRTLLTLGRDTLVLPEQ